MLWFRGPPSLRQGRAACAAAQPAVSGLVAYVPSPGPREDPTAGAAAAATAARTRASRRVVPARPGLSRSLSRFSRGPEKSAHDRDV